MGNRLIFVGTYTGGESRGIYAFWLDTATGALVPIGLVAEAENPSFLALHPTLDALYAICELGTPDGSDGGRLLAYTLDRESGRLDLRGEQSTRGGWPCHLSLDSQGRHLMVSNYMGASVALFSLRADGSLEAMTDLRRHHGSGPNPARQRQPHPHSIWIDPQDRFVFSPDLGIDRVIIYRLDHANGKLIDHGSAPLAPGAGPRHLAFHPSGRYVYVINELDSTVTAFAYDTEQGLLTQLHTVSTLPEGYAKSSTCADIHVHPSGRFLYGSNRGHDSIAMYEIDEATGRLTFMGCQSTLGKTPRNFALDPSGRLLLAANQESDSIVAFFVDPQTGHLTPTGHEVEIPVPVCIKVL